jgi:chromatin modification-related protein VID21
VANFCICDRGRHFQEDTLPETVAFTLRDATPVPSQVQLSTQPTPVQAHSPLSPLPDVADKQATRELTQKSLEPLTRTTPPLNTPTPPRSPVGPQISEVNLSVSTSDEPALLKQRPTNDDVSIEEPKVDSGIALPSGAEIVKVIGDKAANRRKEPSRHPKVVHLPPKEEQLKHFKRLEPAQAQQLQRERREADGGHSVSIDAASSPSSTAGAYSNSTPKPLQQSPDTSPDGGLSPPHRLEVPDTGSSLAENTDACETTKRSGQPREQVLPDSIAEDSGNHTQATIPSSLPDLKGGMSDAVDIASAIEPRNIIDQAHPGIAGNRTSNLEAKAVVTEIDSQAPVDRDVEMKDSQSATQQTPSTPQITSPSTLRPSTQDPTPQRMTTRVASGAIRQKSVSEILGGGTCKPVSAHADRSSVSSQVLVHPPKSSRGSVPGTPVEDRPKISMVVFSKREKDRSPKVFDSEEDGYLALRGAADDLEKDYMRPLFLQQAYSPPRAATLHDLISSANKTITTMNVHSMLKERTDYNILKRIYTMQNANKWSLRQMKRFQDPPISPCYLDHLLVEMKWMRTDFREERKWKVAMAWNLAKWCSEYVNAISEEDKQQLRVRTRPRRGTIDSQEHTTADSSESTPPLIHSGSTESDHSSVEELPRVSTIAPTTLFSLNYDSLFFKLDPTPAADDILAELPLFEPRASEPLQLQEDSLVPVSKFATGKIVPKPVSVPKKRSRYQYEEEEVEPTVLPPAKRRASEVSLFLSPARRSPRYKELTPEESDVALFNPSNRHIRERLHATHAFRPPSEFLMPQTSFFESRIPSQWLWDEDQRLRTCVRKYSYNWSLIAMEMQSFTQPSMMISGTERRTPWECFERWVQLEGLPNDMGKTQYFRTYQNRLEVANKLVAEKRPQQQMQQVQTPGQPSQARYKGTQPFRVERRREARYVNMIDAIRKLARKRETHLHRQQESAKAAALRKQQNENRDSQQSRSVVVHTPAEFSRMKYDRELKIQERQEIYRQQMLQQQRVSDTIHSSLGTGILTSSQASQMQQRVNQVQTQQQQSLATVANGTNRQAQNGTPNSANGPSPPTAQMVGPQQQPQQQQVLMSGMNPPRPSSSQNALPNGLTPNTAATIAGIQPGMPAAQMQAQMQALQNAQQPQRMAAQNPDAVRLAIQRQHVMAQQQALIQQQQQQQNQAMTGQNNHNSLAAAHLSPANSATGMQNPQMLAALAAARAQANGSMNGGMNGSMNGNMGGANNQTSPPSHRPSAVNHVGQNQYAGQLSSGLIPSINSFVQQVHAANPGWPPEKVQSTAQERLKAHVQVLQRSAAAAAAGNSPVNMNLGMSMGMAGMGGGLNVGMSNMVAPMAGNSSQFIGGQQGGGGGMNGNAMGLSPTQFQAHLQRQAQQQVARMSSGGNGASLGVPVSPALSQARPLSRSATPAGAQGQGVAMMHQRSGSGHGSAIGGGDGGMGSPMIG